MTGAWLRRTLSLIFGVAFAVSMSVSVVHATTMAVKMTMAPAMASSTGKCIDCEDGHDAKATGGCQFSVCMSSTVAMLTPGFIVSVDARVQDRLVSTQRSLVGRPPVPDPDPPRSADLH